MSADRDSTLEPVLDPIVIHGPINGVVGVPDVSDAGSTETTVDGIAPVELRLPPVTIVSRPDQVPASVEAEATAVAPKRASSVDALRGLFLIAMTLGFTVPENPVLPYWMYHRQFPPGTETPLDVAGLAWRDLTYVAFLFTMAAALPLTISRRLDAGETEIAVFGAALKRYALLLVFALLIGHANTYFIGYTQVGRTLAVVGFAVMAMLFTRRRKDWSVERFRVMRAVGWVSAILFFALSPLAYGERFSFGRIDDVIAGLAFASLSGSIIWYATRHNRTARLGILGVAVALYLGAKSPGWIQDWWYSSPAPWAFQGSRLGLLVIVIPGTIAGDLVLEWTRARRDAGPEPWGSVRLWAIAAAGFAFIPLAVIGLTARQVSTTTQLAAALGAGAIALTWGPKSPIERFLRSAVTLGIVWLMIGLFLDPFEGGIRKVPETLSYFFVVTGLSTLLLGSLTAVVDGLGLERRLGALIAVGHNPMLCYVLFTVLINSVLELVPPLRGVMRGSIPAALARSAIEVAVVVLIVRAASRRRIYWRT